MKNIDKIIHHKIFEIVIAFFVIAVSFPIWKALDINEHVATAAFYNEAQYTFMNITDNQINSMFPISDENAMKNLKKTTINIANDTKTEESYSVVLKITKDSTIDYKCLNVSINDKKYELNDLYILEDADYYYFSLITSKIVGNTELHEFLMWMDSATGNEMQGKTLNYSFELQKGIMV